MKKLTNVKSVLENGKLTITADVVETAPNEFSMPVQQSTIGYLNPLNPRWPRHCQISGDAFFVKAFGFGMAIYHDDLVAIAATVEPKTSFPPVLDTIDQDLKLEFHSELAPDLQWQVTDDAFPQPTAPHTPPPVPVWTDIEGATSVTLDRSLVVKGQYVRCLATSEAGTAATPPIKII